MGDIADQTIRHLERAVRVAERNRTAKDTRVSTKVGSAVLTDFVGMVFKILNQKLVKWLHFLSKCAGDKSF